MDVDTRQQLQWKSPSTQGYEFPAEITPIHSLCIESSLRLAEFPLQIDDSLGSENSCSETRSPLSTDKPPPPLSAALKSTVLGKLLVPQCLQHEATRVGPY